MSKDWPELNLTKKEWKELVTLEYVITQGYSDDLERDTRRLKKLREKRWKNEDGVHTT